MTYPQARLWLVKHSLVMIGGFGAFLLFAPATPYPLFFDQAIHLLQIILPLFIGYVSFAIVFVSTARPEAEDPNAPRTELSDMFRFLVKGPFFVVFILLVVSLVSFGVVNWPRESALPSDFSFDMLSNLTAFILSIHTATTSALVAWLFKSEAETGTNEN